MNAEFVETVMRLKDETRTGWAERGVSSPESVAAHTFGTAFLTWLLGDDDDGRAIKMALVHDIHESISGDIPSGGLDEDALEEKKDVEAAAFAELLAAADSDVGEMEALWQEYEERETETARFVKDMDLLDLVLQAYIYEKDDRYDAGAFMQEHGAMDEFFAHARERIRTDTAKQVFDDIHARYEAERS